MPTEEPGVTVSKCVARRVKRSGRPWWIVQEEGEGMLRKTALVRAG
jgi:hypothetical protein